MGTISNSHIHNNVDLVNKLNNLRVDHDFILVSYDVTQLFTRVPVNDLLVYLEEELENHDLPLPTATIIDLIKLCVLESYFVFNGKYYLQNFGMAMGNPISPILSNLYMEFFETKLLPSILPHKVTWFRYLDDILCIWPVNDDPSIFLSQLN